MSTELFETLVAMQLRHWPSGQMWVELRHPLGTARLYPDGVWELVALR